MKLDVANIYIKHYHQAKRMKGLEVAYRELCSVRVYLETKPIFDTQDESLPPLLRLVVALVLMIEALDK
ncbi:hypothetical protein ACLF2M_003399 [Vibrio vulnificus]